MSIIIGMIIGCINIYFAFRCVKIANEKNRSNNFWVIMACLFGIFAYLIIRDLPSLDKGRGDEKGNGKGKVTV